MIFLIEYNRSECQIVKFENYDDSNFNINNVKASRMINSKGDSRGKINELVITNYPNTIEV